MAGRTRQGLRKGIAIASGQDCTGTPLRKDGVDMPELEPAKHRLLSVTRSCTHEGLDDLSTGRCRIGATKQIKEA